MINKIQNNSLNNIDIMLLLDELDQSLQAIKILDLSDQLFLSLSTSLFQLSVIFVEDVKLKPIATILSEFGQMLSALDLMNIDIVNYGAFDLLGKIIEDVIIFVKELSVDQTVQDVKIIEDSMENNINYFEAQLLGLSAEDTEDLEFF